MTTWEEKRLGDFLELQRGFDLPSSTRRPGTVPIISSSGVTGTHDKAAVQGPGVVTGRYGTLGQVFYVKQDFWPLNTSLFVKKFKGVEPRFAAYLLESLPLAHSEGAGAVPGVNRNVLHQLPVRVPDRDGQRRISSSLAHLDDLIENNLRRIGVLEAIGRHRWDRLNAMATFDEAPVAEVLENGGGTTPSRAIERYWTDPEADVDWYTPTDLTKSGFMFATHAAERLTASTVEECGLRQYPARSVMMTSRATIGAIAINTEQACTNQGFIVCIPNDRIPLYVLFHWMRSNVERFKQLATGSTFKELTRGTFRALKIRIPARDDAEAFERDVAPVYDLALSLQRRVHVLRKLRDLLLPKLLSGEIDVSRLPLPPEEPEVAAPPPPPDPPRRGRRRKESA